jgi:hypothetical protein
MTQTTSGTDASHRHSRAQLLALARILVECGTLASPHSVIDYFEARGERPRQQMPQPGLVLEVLRKFIKDESVDLVYLSLPSLRSIHKPG